MRRPHMPRLIIKSPHKVRLCLEKLHLHHHARQLLHRPAGMVADAKASLWVCECLLDLRTDG